MCVLPQTPVFASGVGSSFHSSKLHASLWCPRHSLFVAGQTYTKLPVVPPAFICVCLLNPWPLSDAVDSPAPEKTPRVMYAEFVHRLHGFSQIEAEEVEQIGTGTCGLINPSGFGGVMKVATRQNLYSTRRP